MQLQQKAKMNLQIRSMDRTSVWEKKQQTRLQKKQIHQLVLLQQRNLEMIMKMISIQIQLLEMDKVYPRRAKKLINADNIVIFYQNYCRAEFACKLLKLGKYLQTKIFILISNHMTWSTTPLNDRKKDETEMRQSMGGKKMINHF
ncbi:unnamed protein product [Paramecium sonneborni]|uniref:Uncharacterized protein n=1 Tax=Paramecium sonneborni TaxID=65129 RepID=A0A8S1M8A1_9CILI|nr:unnamed protein product [Paramecium sonneborni]